MTKNLRVVAILAVAAIPWAGAPGRCGEPAPISRPRTDLSGDPLPPGALARMGTIRYARGDSTDGPPVLAPDHKTFATVSRYTPCGAGRVVCLWDAATGRELCHLDDPDFEPYGVFFLKGEKVIGTFGISREEVKGSSFTYAMQLWDPLTGRKVATPLLDPTCSFETWALSPDEDCLAAATVEAPLVVRERKTGKELAKWKSPERFVRCLAFSPDGKTLAICGDKDIRFWDWKGNKKDRSIAGLPDGAARIWFSPDCRWVAATIYREGVRVWDMEELKEVRRFAGEYDVRFLPDGKRLVSLDTGVVRDVASGKQVGQLEDCASCLALDISEDSKEVMGYADGRVRLWDAETGKDRSPAISANLPIMIHQIGFLPGGKEVVSASPDGAVRIWDAASGKEVRTVIPGTEWDPQKNQPILMRVAPNGTIIVARRDRLTFFTKEGKEELSRRGRFCCDGMSLSPDGKRLLAAAAQGNVVLMEWWGVVEHDSTDGFASSNSWFTGTMALASDRRFAALAGSAVCLLNEKAEASQTLLPLGDRGSMSWMPGVQALAFSPDGELLAFGSPGGGLKVLDAVTGKPRYSWPGRNTAELFNVAFSRDGRMLAAEAEEGLVDVWEVSTGRKRRRLRGHRSYQTTLAFSPDGARLATGNRDATILIWDVFRKFGDDGDGPLTGAELDALWSRLLYQDAEQACWAMGRLMRHSDESGPYLKRRVLGRKGPAVVRIKRRIAGLGSDDFETREAASADLAKWLAAAAPLLKERLADNPSPEARRRMEELLARWERRELPAESIRDLRALEVLESFGAASADAARELAEGDYDGSVAAAAKAVLKRLTAK